MDDLISRDYLREIVGRMPAEWEYGAAVSDIYDIIMKAPAVDAVPVARLMGGDEIAALRENDVVWYEQHAPDGDYLAAMVANGRGEIGNADMCVALKYLDAGERLWTARPSVEQRGAVAWP